MKSEKTTLNKAPSSGLKRKTLSGAPQKTIKHIVTGGVLSSDFFFKYKLYVFIIVVLLVLYIATKYQCLTGMESIQKLEQELEVVKTERIRESSRYMSRIRESSMTNIADSVRPGLRVQQQPPYIIKTEKK